MKIPNFIIDPARVLEDFVAFKILGVERILSDFEERTKNFSKCQEEVLDEIISKNEATRWGRDHRFSGINHDNWNSMPIVTYEQIKPYVERIKNGDIFALTSEMPRVLTKTSGTTAEPKFILLTNKSIKSQKQGADIWNFSLEQHKEYLNKILVLSGGMKEKQTELIPISSYTSEVKALQPFYVQKRMIFKKQAEVVSDFEHRLLIAAQQAFIRQPTTLISVNPMTILRLVDLTEENKVEIGRATIRGKYVCTDIDIGTIKNIDTVLSNIFSKGPLDSVKFIGTWLGGTQNIFVDKLKSKGINVPMRDLGYLATEGRFTIPIQDDSPRGILNPFGNFYEFMTTDKKNLIPLQELKKGEEYNILLTSENGLYRYDIQDIVGFEGFYNNAPMISFKRKDSCFSSLIGEKLHENNVVELLRKLNLNTGILRAEVLPSAHYSLNIPDSYKRAPAISKEHADNVLQSLNPEYHAKRENNRLSSLEINFLSDSEFSALDKLVNPNQEHDRFKRKYLMPIIT